MKQSKKKKLQNNLVVFYRSLVVGGISATITKTLVAPIERTKIILQTQHQNPELESEFTGMIDCLIKLWKRQKTRPFYLKPLTYWRGNGTNVIRYFPMQSITFAFKSQFKRLLAKKNTSFFEYFMRNLAIGGLAGATGFTIIYPLDVARTRLTADVSMKYRGLMDCIVKLYREEGFRAIYKGYTVSVSGMIPYRAVYFGGYDMAKSFVRKRGNELNFWNRWAISQTTSVISQWICYPHDTVRKRMQMYGSGENRLYRNAVDCFRKVYREEGVRAFYRGAGINTIRATGCSLCLVFYDSIGKFIFKGKNFGN